MGVSWQSFATGTEVGVMADYTLVPVTGDVGKLVLAKRTITENAIMGFYSCGRLGDCFIDRDKAMARVILWSVLNTLPAVVPVRTTQALVADTHNALEDVSSVQLLAKEGNLTLSHPSQMAAW